MIEQAHRLLIFVLLISVFIANVKGVPKRTKSSHPPIIIGIISLWLWLITCAEFLTLFELRSQFTSFQILLLSLEYAAPCMLAILLFNGHRLSLAFSVVMAIYCFGWDIFSASLALREHAMRWFLANSPLVTLPTIAYGLLTRYTWFLRTNGWFAKEENVMRSTDSPAPAAMTAQPRWLSMPGNRVALIASALGLVVSIIVGLRCSPRQGGIGEMLFPIRMLQMMVVYGVLLAFWFGLLLARLKATRLEISSWNSVGFLLSASLYLAVWFNAWW